MIGCARTLFWGVLGLSLLWAVPARAEQLVLLDPGHGGTNVGAFGPPSGLYEKTLTLDLAKRVKRYLTQWAPKVRVELTRTRDTYLTLQQRVRLANELKATLFVSLHCNASPSHSQQGYEIYILSREASAKEAARLTLSPPVEPISPPAGVKKAPAGPSPADDPTVAAIVANLQQNATYATSAALARTLQQQLRQARGKARDRGLRQAPFDVLLGLRMPGALVEVGFIDHPLEGKDLAQVAVREQLAVALAAGIARQLRQLQPKEPVARAEK